MAQKTLSLKPQFRSIKLDRAAVDTDNRTVPLSFSSETPYERWWGVETLDHSAGALRLDRLTSGGPLLVDHDPTQQIGVIEEVTIGTDRTGRAVVRFGKSPRAEQEYQDVLDGIRQNVSVGYQIHRMVLEEEKDGKEHYRILDWEPLEISLVSIPADITVGVGRSESGEAHEVVIEASEPDETEQQPATETDIDNTQTTEQEIKTMEIEVSKAREEARQQELDRTRQISAIGEQHQMRELAQEHIGKGSSVDEMRAAVLERLGKIQKVTTSAEIGLTDKEARQFSMLRVINALANPGDRKLAEAAAFEFECSRAVADVLRRSPQGCFLPLDVQKRDLTVGTASAGGNLKATNLLAGSFIDMLRNRMMVQKMGAYLLDGLVGDVAIPSQTGGATAYWVAENTAPTESNQTFGQVTLAPKTVGTYTDLSRKLILQSTPAAEMLVERDLATTIALGIDLAALHGTGADNQPRGIAATSGIGSVAGGDNGAAPTWANIVSLWSEVATDNADLGATGFLTNSKVIGKLMTTEKASGTAQFVCPSFPDAEGMTTLGGARCGVSNQVASNLVKGTSGAVASAIFFGNWNDLLIGQWGTADILVDPYTGSAAGTVRVRILQDADVAVRHAQSFAAMLDALTA